MDIVSKNPQRLTRIASEERNNSSKTSLESCFRAILLQLPGCGTSRYVLVHPSIEMYHSARGWIESARATNFLWHHI
jgi:hypothetical protein